MTSQSNCDFQRQLVLIVDDSPDNLILISSLLKGRYRVKVANSGERALRVATTEETPDLILLDIVMPGMDGYEVCRQLRVHPNTCDVPIIFLTAKSSPEDEARGLEMGAVDYIAKPVSPPIVQVRVATHLQLKASSDFLRNENDFLEAEVQRRTQEVQAIQDVTIMAMASLAETRDSDTGNHIRRTQHYVRLLAEYLKEKGNPRFASFLTEGTIGMLFKCAPLHDIGKVGIPDRILLKPGRLEPAEFEIMKTHTALGRNAIERAESVLGLNVAFLHLAKEIAYYHHEKWDGSGYPEGISGEAIPISACLMAVADVYDALISRRIYKEPMPHEKAVRIIVENKGTHFDPDIVDAFETLQDQFRLIAATYADGDAELEAKMRQMEQATGLG